MRTDNVQASEQKKSLTSVWWYVAIYAYVLVPVLVSAGERFVNPIKQNDLRSFLVQILSTVVYIMFPIIVLMVVYTGFLFVSAQGNESKLSEARRSLLWTVVGALVVLGSMALTLAIEATVTSIAG